jgi:itaconate CoA-transferase
MLDEPSDHERGGLLDGLTVVALEQAVALPFATFIFAELGATVIKLERPQGEVIRGWDSVVDGTSAGFVWLNAGKKDIAVDLSDPAGRDLVLKLVAKADVFVENFAPGVAARLGLSRADVESVNNDIVYCSLSGFGQTGPFEHRKAYDLIVQGESGLLLTNGSPEAPAKVGIPVTDLIGGSTAAVLVLAALIGRQGRYLDVGMLDSVMTWLGYYPHFVWHGGGEPTRTGLRHQYTVPYGPYLASDARYVNIAVASASHWKGFCRDVVQHPEWESDPLFSTAERRTHNRSELEELVESEIAKLPAQKWIDRCEQAGIPFGAVRTIGEALDHPQVVDRGMRVEATLNGQSVPLFRYPESVRDRARLIPRLGEHTRELMLDVGYSDAEIDRLVEHAVVVSAS